MGLFDTMFGGAGVYKDMLDPEMMKQIQQQSQLAMAAQLLAAGGPSPTRTSIGQALGKGLMAGQQAQQGGVTNAAQSMLLKQKMDEYKRQTNYLAALQGQGAGAETQVPTAAPMTSGQALGLPNMQLGPTNARASMIGQTPAVPKLSEQDRLYNDLMRKSQLAAKYNMQDESSKYFDQALKVKPTPQVTGQPFEVSDLQGNPIMLQQFSDGSTQTMQGFGPRRNVSLQSFGGKMVAVDNNQLQAGQSFEMSMSPDAQASNLLGQQNLGLNQAKFAYGQGQDVLSNARADKQLNISAQTAANSGGGTVEERKAAMFVGRLEGAKQVFDAPVMGPDGKPMTNQSGAPITIENAFGKPGVLETMFESAPFGETLANQARSAGRQQYRQAQEDWVTAILRPESGAVIGPEEMQSKIVTFFPQIGDAPPVIAQKKAAREASEKGLRLMAGRALRGSNQNTEFNWVDGKLVPVNN